MSNDDNGSETNKAAQTNDASSRSVDVGVIVTALSGLLIVAYIMGWSYTDAYFREIGAPWLMNVVPPRLILINSAIPVFLLMGAFSSMLVDMPRVIWTRKGINFMITYVLVTMPIVLMFGFSLRQTLGVWLMRLLVFSAAFGYAIIFVSVVKDGLLQPRNEGVKSKEFRVLSAYLVCMFGLYLAPAMMGRSEGLAAINPISTTLPILEARDAEGKSQILHLLLATDEKVYALDPKPKILKDVVVVPWGSVVSVRLQNP